MKEAPLRIDALDFLRGMAILGMVLAAVIPWSASWPAWMYHAQISPPSFVYNPNQPGITWVDLVFPFFLLAMGISFPLALTAKLKEGHYRQIVVGILRRGVLLLFFACSLAYFNASSLKGSTLLNQGTALLVFGSYFLVFIRWKQGPWQPFIFPGIGFVLIAALGYYHAQVLGYAMQKENANIILVVLANMAVFGSFIWLLTSDNWMLRIGVLAIYAAIWLTHDLPNAWTAELWNFHPALAWFYKLGYLKYLNIVLLGTILGDILLKHKGQLQANPGEGSLLASVSLLSILFISFHVITLYMRELPLNRCGHLAFGLLYYLLLRRKPASALKTICGWGYFLVCLGLFFEPFEGGIKKDPSSFSYWFLTAGLGFVAYLCCAYITRVGHNFTLVKAVIRCGQNPMLAYCITAFFISPILTLTQLLPWFDYWSNLHPNLGILRTITYMFLVIFLTNYASVKKWYWKS